MQFETLFPSARVKPVIAALAGCGEFGMSLIAQSRRMEGLTIRAVRPHRPSLEDLFMQAVTDPHTGEVLAPGAAPARARGARP